LLKNVQELPYFVFFLIFMLKKFYSLKASITEIGHLIQITPKNSIKKIKTGVEH